MNTYRFSLDNSRPTKLFRCPQCNKKTLKRYCDNERNEYLGEEVGRCNREVNCGYHYKPKDYFAQHSERLQGKRAPFDRLRVTHRAAAGLHSTRPFSIFHGEGADSDLTEDGIRPIGVRLLGAMPSVHPVHPSTHTQTVNNEHPDSILTDIKQNKDAIVNSISYSVFKSSLSHYGNNHFISYLVSLFGDEVTQQLITKYCIGTSKHWNGANIFWQVDRNNIVRTGKVMQYNTATGKRDKLFTWAHTLLNLPDFKLKQCLFGEHLLNSDLHKPIAIAEGEKTAIIASVYLPEYIWMASGGLDQLNIEKLQVLKGRNIILYPDLIKPGAKDKWSVVAAELIKQRFSIRINTILETIATNEDRIKGLDIADYLLRMKNEKVKAKNEIKVNPDAVEPLKQMIAKNPAIQTLMDKLGIVGVSLGR